MDSADFTVIFYLMVLLGVATGLIQFMTYARVKHRAQIREQVKKQFLDQEN